jgi:hypothetical protein
VPAQHCVLCNLRKHPQQVATVVPGLGGFAAPEKRLPRAEEGPRRSLRYVLRKQHKHGNVSDLPVAWRRSLKRRLIYQVFISRITSDGQE